MLRLFRLSVSATQAMIRPDVGYRGLLSGGSAILTFMVDNLPLGWPAIFAVYGGGYLILLLYPFCPYPKGKNRLA